MGTVIELVAQQAVSAAVAAAAGWVVSKMQSREEVQKLIRAEAEERDRKIKAVEDAFHRELKEESDRVKESLDKLQTSVDKASQEASAAKTAATNAVKSEEFDRFVSDNTEKWLALQKSLGYIEGLLKSTIRG